MEERIVNLGRLDAAELLKAAGLPVPPACDCVRHAIGYSSDGGTDLMQWVPILRCPGDYELRDIFHFTAESLPWDDAKKWAQECAPTAWERDMADLRARAAARIEVVTTADDPFAAPAIDEGDDE